MAGQPIVGTETDAPHLASLARLNLRGRHLRLVVDGGEPVDVPEPVVEALAEVISVMRQGRAVAVVPQNTQLTTGEAAQLLGVTRPTVVKLMEDGVLPFERPNSSRRVALRDVLAYTERRTRARREALDQMTAELADAGVYDQDARRGRDASAERP
ncbi:excisionase family DNA-binding protein [Actinocrinis sp.]|uniref:excisionase family DNA-binding protein n=1 Tax=Actinocrinis sp. TaxID=1920516 RepID=UPI002D5B6AA0|nr:excisionase family DNA-binding protein [Actinocrinis sp.]HZP55069.1 excisionase family DNA-binding protein [Actinocrinis sp.]